MPIEKPGKWLKMHLRSFKSHGILFYTVFGNPDSRLFLNLAKSHLSATKFTWPLVLCLSYESAGQQYCTSVA